MVPESRVTWPTSVPIFVFLGLSVLDLGPTERERRKTDVRRASSLNASVLCPDAISVTTNDSHHIETADDTVFEQIFTHPNNVLAPLFPEKVGTRYQIRPRNHDWQFVPKNQ